MKKVFLFLFVAILSTSCNGQDQNSAKKDVSKSENKGDSLQDPKERWEVNKELDEDGNIIRYDSIYTWSSSGNLKGMHNDSILNKMKSKMQRRFSMFRSPKMNALTEHDSIMKQFFSNDFFKDDFFLNGSDFGFPNMDDMIKRMEAMRQQFFDNNHRYIIPPEEKKNKAKSPKVIEKKQV